MALIDGRLFHILTDSFILTTLTLMTVALGAAAMTGCSGNNQPAATSERAEKYDFTDPYAYIRTAVIVNGDNDEIQSFDDLNGKSTANTISSTYAELAESYGAGELTDRH